MPLLRPGEDQGAGEAEHAPAPRRFYVALKVQSFAKSLELTVSGQKLPVRVGDELPRWFLPVFAERAEAVEWGGPGCRIIMVEEDT